MLCRQPDAPEREVVKVLDFGIAKVLDPKRDATLPSQANTSVRSSLTRVGALVGTPAYMSPEQGRAERVDGRSDIYSVGVLLYELLCGRPPFEGETPLQIVARHVHEPPAPLSSRSPVVPRPLEAIVHRMLAKDPASRPQTAREAAETLADLAMDLARRTTGPTDRWQRRAQLLREQAPPPSAVPIPQPSIPVPAIMAQQRAALPPFAPPPYATQRPPVDDVRIDRLNNLVKVLLVLLIVALLAIVVLLVVVVTSRPAPP
jgi:eukaryotic-like serine/threonine-protein kinase